MNEFFGVHKLLKANGVEEGLNYIAIICENHTNAVAKGEV